MAVGDPPREMGIETELGQSLERARDGQEMLVQLFLAGLRRAHQDIEPDCLLDSERSDAQPPQVAQVRADAEALAEIVGERSQVGSLRATNENAGVRWIEAGQARLLDVDGARLALDLLARPGQLVEALPLDLARRVHRRSLQDEPDEPAQGVAGLVLAQVPHRPGLQDPPRCVLRVGDLAEPDGGLVLLLAVSDEPGHLGRLADADGQDARAGGIERPGVPAALDLEEALHPADHVERGGPARLVHDHHARRLRHARAPLPPRSR